MTTKGTKEWAYKNVNICYGCSNNCSYCYAKRMAIRFKRIETSEEWEDMKTNWRQVNRGYRKIDNPTNKFDYMFPTSHDITPQNITECIIVLEKILEAGNTVLITTKPRDDCIEDLCQNLYSWKDQVLFRFTITSASDRILKKYEPNAPDYEARYQSVWRAFYEYDFKTSLSIEPFLDEDPIYLITRFFKINGKGVDIITNNIWLGIMSGPVPKELKPNYTKENIANIIKNIKKLPENVRNKIKLKDSLHNMGFSLN